MKYFSKFALSLCLIVLSLNANAANTIHFATEATYAPLVYLDKNGSISGFEAEIVRALCATLKDTTCELKHQGWDSLIPSLKLGKIDAIFGGLAITEERKNQVAFTKPLYASSVGYIIPSDKPITFDDEGLMDKVVGVQLGTTMEHYFHEQYPNVEMKAYASLQDALLDIQTGRIDTVLGDAPVLLAWMKGKPADKYRIVEIPKDQIDYFGPGNAIAVNQKNTALLNELNTAIDTITKNGKLAEISAKYLPKAENTK